MADKKWIQSAIKHPGALRATAKKAGAINNGGNIDVDWLQKAAAGKYGSTTEKRAELALTLRKMNK